MRADPAVPQAPAKAGAARFRAFIGTTAAGLRSARQTVRRHRVGGSPILRWIKHGAWSTVTALLLFVIVEAVAKIFRVLPLSGPGWGLDHRATPDAFETFVAALVGSLAAFLALFFATLGVVAAAAYTNASSDVRQLFLRGRENTVYVNTVVRALMFGSVLLAAHAVGYHPYTATVAVFWILCVLSLLGSAGLGLGLFSFFDLGQLATPLPEDFRYAVRCAADTIGARARPGPSRAAPEQASKALRIMREVLRLAGQRGSLDLSAFDALNSTLEMWKDYAQHKPAIATNGPWFPATAQQSNWLMTGNLAHVQHPLASAPTRTGPDMLWVERELLENYLIVLRPAVTGQDWQTAAKLIDPASELVFWLVARLQVSEALLLCQATSAVIDLGNDHAGDPAAGGDMAPDQVLRSRFRIAAAEAGTAVRTQLWTGLAAAASRLSSPEIQEYLERAAHAPNAPDVAAALPISATARETLDVLCRGLAVERSAAGAQITPGWWLRHHVGRTLSRSLFTASGYVEEDLHDYIGRRLPAVAALEDPEALANFAISALVAIRRAEYAFEVVQQTLASLAALQHTAADDPWPKWTLTPQTLVQHRPELLRRLAGATEGLPDHPYTGDAPDVFGRALAVLTDELFDAVITGDDAAATALFPVALRMALRARRRVAFDSEDLPSVNRILHVTAPVTDMMLISGYAMFLNVFDGRGIWPQARQAWDEITASADAVASLADELDLRQRTAPSDMRRLPWAQAFNHWLEQHGLEPLEATRFPHQRRGTRHASPIIFAVLGLHGRATFVMANLFLLEYMLASPGGQSVQPGRSSRDLRDALAREREDTGEE